jgi:hypothetical protein
MPTGAPSRGRPDAGGLQPRESTAITRSSRRASCALTVSLERNRTLSPDNVVSMGFMVAA